jgi:poly[(R)-3-hydroxyalkanoate] polymerase subunit PhaC
MAESSPFDVNPMDTWNKLVDNTLAGYPATQVIAQAARDGKEDAWVSFVDSTWEANPLSQVVPIDPGANLKMFQAIWLDYVRNPLRPWLRYTDYVQQYTRMVTDSTLRFWGLGKDVKPVIEPDKSDRRFNAPDWQQNPVFDAIKQGYLLTATTLLRMVSEIEGLDNKQQQALQFYLRQVVDAMSPANFLLTNPQAIHETIATGGQNVRLGMQHLMRDMANGEIKITDTDAFEVGRNLAITPGEVVYRNELIELIQYTPTTEKVYSIPLLFVPPWINKFYILDLQPHNSIVKFLVDRGFTVFAVSWKNPDASMENIGFDDYVTLGPLAALDVVKQISGSPTVNMIGYCIAGTMISTVPSYLKAQGDTKSINSMTFVVTLHDFETTPGDMMVFLDDNQMRHVERQMRESGVLDSRSMATMFQMLRANDLIWSNYVNNYLLGKEPPAFDILYWNNDGTRMTRKAHTYYLRNICMLNGFTKPGEIVVKGVPVDLKQIRQDVYAVGTQQDHIVPWKAAWRVTQLVGGHVRFVLGASGHTAGISTPPEKGKGFWTNDKPVHNADEWFEGATQHKGSWWSDWAEWLKPRSGKQVPPPSMGSEAYPPLTPAPGTYVFEK